MGGNPCIVNFVWINFLFYFINLFLCFILFITIYVFFFCDKKKRQFILFIKKKKITHLAPIFLNIFFFFFFFRVGLSTTPGSTSLKMTWIFCDHSREGCENSDGTPFGVGSPVLEPPPSHLQTRAAWCSQNLCRRWAAQLLPSSSFHSNDSFLQVILFLLLLLSLILYCLIGDNETFKLGEGYLFVWKK